MMLRSFRACGNVAPVSPSVQCDPTGSLVFPLTFPCVLENLDGIVAGPGYLQIFDRAIAPVTTVTAPLLSIRVSDDGTGLPMPLPSYLAAAGGLVLSNGLYIAMSSTQAVYTALATSFDVYGSIDEFEGVLQPDTLSSVSANSASSIAVWTDGDGPKKLVEVRIASGGTFAATSYLQLFAIASPGVTDRPIVSWPLYDVNGIAVTLPLVRKFGRDGLNVMDVSSGTVRKACTLGISTTPGVFTVDGTASVNFTCLYK